MKISNINIDKYVQGLKTELTARNQGIETNLLGDYIIDRGKLKYKLDFNINLIDSSEWAKLKQIMRGASFPVTFYDDESGKEITRDFTTKTLPSPVLLRVGAGDSAIYHYANISLSLEEI